MGVLAPHVAGARQTDTVLSTGAPAVEVARPWWSEGGWHQDEPPGMPLCPLPSSGGPVAMFPGPSNTPILREPRVQGPGRGGCGNVRAVPPQGAGSVLAFGGTACSVDGGPRRARNTATSVTKVTLWTDGDRLRVPLRLLFTGTGAPHLLAQ